MGYTPWGLCESVPTTHLFRIGMIARVVGAPLQVSNHSYPSSSKVPSY
jgi:hypothetical protein